VNRHTGRLGGLSTVSSQERPPLFRTRLFEGTSDGQSGFMRTAVSRLEGLGLDHRLSESLVHSIRSGLPALEKKARDPKRTDRKSLSNTVSRARRLLRRWEVKQAMLNRIH
jgi:hypothetical protein